ncbi:OmpA family protein [Frigidibacter oleivorans]|uniref:OmpA family protein n=1 Tax=Frigidibacter oleivorans TaxID=2487129 RepID=UPI000F8E1FD5|nr:OmpA family protein [Frigidibacter oleivorans]
MRLSPKALGIHGLGLIAFALAALLAWAAATWAATAMERASESAVRRVLLEQGYSWARAEADGLNVAIYGEAPTEAQRFRALGAAGTVVDAQRVIDAMTVPDAAAIEAPEFSLEILRNDDGISLIGLLPERVDRDAVLSRLKALSGEGGVTDMLETADHPVPAGWQAAQDFGLAALADLPRSKLSIGPGRVQVTAITDSADQKARLEADLRRRAPKGVALVLDISAPRPVITPFTLRFVIDEQGPHFDACSADTDRARTRILTTARDLDLPESADCVIGMGVPSPDWAAAAEVSMRAMAELGAGSVTLSDADVSLIAADSVEQAAFDRVVGELDAALPEVFSLTAVLTPKPETAAPEGPPELTATLAEDGRVQLRGRLPDELTRDAVTSFARARFGNDRVYMATRLDPSLPEGWPVRALAALEALDRVETGDVRVQPDLVTVNGVTGYKDTPAEIARLLSQKLGEGQEFDIAVRYMPDLDPTLALPSAEECVARINARLAETQIAFEPGEAIISASARPLLDEIAEDLKDCADYPIEVAGHTDSQGGEEMNLALSEDRAEAVIAALMQRRILTGNLFPRGYGETRPVADNDTDAGREANRRIEFTLLSGTGAGDEAGTAAAGEPGPGDIPVASADAAPGRPEPRPEEVAAAGENEAAEDTAEEPAAAEDAAPASADTLQEALDAGIDESHPGTDALPEDGSGEDMAEPQQDDAPGEATEEVVAAEEGTEAVTAEDAPPAAGTETTAGTETADTETAETETSEPAPSPAEAAAALAAAEPGAAPAGTPFTEVPAAAFPVEPIEVQVPGDDTIRPPVRPEAIVERASAAAAD